MHEKIFERVNLSVLAESLIYGVHNENKFDASYNQRIKAAEIELVKQLDQLLETSKSEEVQEIVFQYQAMTNPIYFELGMKAGAMIYRQLFEGVPGDIKVAH